MELTHRLIECVLFFWSVGATVACFILNHQVNQAEAQTKDAQDLRDRAQADAQVMREKADDLAVRHKHCTETFVKQLRITKEREDKIMALTDAIAKLGKPAEPSGFAFKKGDKKRTRA